MKNRIEFLLVLLFSVFFLSQYGVAKESPSSAKDVVEHWDVFYPIAKEAGWLVIKVLGPLMLLLWYLTKCIGKRWMADRKADTNDLKSQNEVLLANQMTMFNSIRDIHGIMMECDGCAAAAKTYTRRKNDLKVLDSEDMHTFERGSIHL